MEIEIQNPNPVVHQHREILSEFDLELRKREELDEDVPDKVDSMEGFFILKFDLITFFESFRFY